MATANDFGDGKPSRLSTLEELYCPTSLTRTPGIHEQLTFLSVLNVFLSITAFLGNALILVALCKDSSLHPPSKLLLRCLTITDLCAGLISKPLVIIYWISLIGEYRNICPYVSAAAVITGLILSGVSLLTVTAISVDRLLALLLGLKYRQVATLKRTYAIVIIFWVVSTALTLMCLWKLSITLWSSAFVVLLCLVTSIISYTKIFFTLRRHQVQLQEQSQQPNQTRPQNMARYKKAVSSAIWLQVTLVICYLPLGIVVALFTDSELSSSAFLANQYTIMLVFLNSSLNPILYCWKVEEVRQAVKETIRQVLCCSS